MSKSYTVIWTIEVDAYTPVHAAELAQKIQRDQNSTANVFKVGDVDIDLDSRDQLQRMIEELDDKIYCLEYGDDSLYTNRNGNLRLFERMKAERARLLKKLEESK